MTKINFNKLGLKKSEEIVNIEYNGQIIEIKQYLPIQEKLELLSKVISKMVNMNKVYNPGQLSVFFKLYMIETYTNITFTDKQKEDFCKTFDLLESNGIFKIVLDAIPETEMNVLESWLLESTEAIYQYSNSAKGILESLQRDYDNLNFDIDAIQNKIKDPETLTLLKEIAPLLDLA